MGLARFSNPTGPTPASGSCNWRLKGTQATYCLIPEHACKAEWPGVAHGETAESCRHWSCNDLHFVTHPKRTVHRLRNAHCETETFRDVTFRGHDVKRNIRYAFPLIQICMSVSAVLYSNRRSVTGGLTLTSTSRECQFQLADS
jgi:hypothetical protein